MKYAAEIINLADCPPPPYTPITDVGYRLCKSEIDDERNFLPNAKRVIGFDVKENSEKCCSRYALSFYTSLEKLKKAIGYGTKNAANLLKGLGDHYVVVELNDSSGHQTKPSAKNGHFDLHESSSFNCKSSVTIHRKLSS